MHGHHAWAWSEQHRQLRLRRKAVLAVTVIANGVTRTVTRRYYLSLAKQKSHPEGSGFP